MSTPAILALSVAAFLIGLFVVQRAPRCEPGMSGVRIGHMLVGGC